MAQKRDALPRTVFALGAVSLCTDAGSEMVLPLLPALLQSLGASMLVLGLLQGIGELIVAGIKLGSGIWSDRWPRRKPWLLVGYGLSTLVRPLFALAASPLAVVGLRSCDRLGKGLRAAPRDAMLADSVPGSRRGAAFGVQRAMDHSGALVGALLAALLLGLGLPLRWVFALALLPGLVAMLVLWRLVQEVPRPPAPAGIAPKARPLRALWPLLGTAALATVSTSVDLFTLARASELGVATSALPLLWALLHVARSSLSQPFGALSDRLGRRGVMGIGLAVHALVLVGFALADAAWWMWPLFALHGLHAALTEGAERSYVASVIGPGRRGLGFGVYHAVLGMAGFVGPVLLGSLWDAYGAGVAFLSVAVAAVLALVWLVVGVQPAPD